MSDKTTPPFAMSEEMRVRMPLRLLLALLGIVAVSAVAWAATRASVEDHDRRLGEVERVQRTQIETLVRIDERTAEMKRQMDRVLP